MEYTTPAVDLAIMYGRNDDCVGALRSFFERVPLVVETWDESPKGSLTIDQIIKRKETATTILIVLTGDDVVELAPPFAGKEPARRYLQARPNVIHELGIAQHEKPEHTFILSLGNSELPSNIEGTYVYRLEPGMSDEQLTTTLRRVAAEIIDKTNQRPSQLKVSQIPFDLGPIRASLNKVTAATAALDPTSDCHLIGQNRRAVDFSEILQRFTDRVYATATPLSHKKVRVFGFTYAAFWIAVERVLSDQQVTDWTFDLHYIAPTFIRNNTDTFGAYWQSDADHREQDMKQWFANTTNTNRLRARRVNVRLRSVNTIPFLHGKLWGDKTINFHTAQWDSNGQLDYPHSFHEIIPATATSERATAYRRLFQNWIRHYDQQTAEQVYASDTIDWDVFTNEMTLLTTS